MALKRFCDNCNREITEKQISTDEDGTQLSAKIGTQKYKDTVTIRFSIFHPGNGSLVDMCVNCVAEAILAVSDIPKKAIAPQAIAQEPDAYR